MFTTVPLARRVLILLALAFAPLAARAQDAPIAFTNARVIPIEGDELDKATLVVHRGKVLALGPAAAVSIPADAQRLDCAGKTIMPGLIDTHSHVGGVAGADGSGPIQPDVRVWDSINPLSPGFRRALAGGITTLNVMPGSGHLLSGQTIYLKNRAAHGEAVAIDRLFFDGPGKPPLGGIKMANGTNSIGSPPFPGTRAKSAALVRDRFIAAQEYKRKLDLAKANPDKVPDRDLALEALVEVLDRKRVVHHHTHRADDIITVLRLQKEFNFRVVLHHVSEAWKVADEIAKAGAPCSVIVVDSPGGKLEAAEIKYETSAILEKAGVMVAVHTDDWITDSRFFRRDAALAVRAGFSRAEALKALTLNGAKMLDLDSRVGSLKAGKDADFLILSGDPFSVYTHVEQTWVEGRKVFDRADPDDLLHAQGGYGASTDQVPYLCCAADGFWFGGKQWGGTGEGTR